LKGEADPARALAWHIANAPEAALTGVTIRATCRDILDTSACMLGGSSAPGIDILRGLAARWGGREEATVLLAGLRVPAHQAALVNGAMAHALDFDDTHDRAGMIHPGAPVLASALAAAELAGSTTGMEFVMAVALGLDVACRVALAAPEDRGWHRTAAMGVFGATAAASRLLRLDAARVEHALGIALSQAAGTRQCIDDGALTKRFQAGQAASAGVLSAVLATEGFTGAQGVFTGRYGFLPMYQPGRIDVNAMLSGLGTTWQGDQVSLKPYPCFRPSHPAIDAAIALRGELGIHNDTPIASVTLETDVRCYADQFEGGVHKRRPRHVIEAQFATPFLVAVALLRGQVRVADVAGLGDANILALADRVTGCALPNHERGWARLTVSLHDGRTATSEVSRATGSPDKPIPDDALDEKFRDCAANAAMPVSRAAADAAIAFVRDLPQQPDLRGLFPSVQMPHARGSAIN
jgi:2-methylcitrate dehydratase PrpD